MRSVRSSSYASDADQVVVTTRNAEAPQNHRLDLGFRCVVEDSTYFAPFCEVPAVYAVTSTQDASSYELCPTLDITQAQYCTRKLPLTKVRFVGPSGSTIDPRNCIPSNDPSLFTCQSPGTIVSIKADCQLNNPGNPSCPAGFSEQENVCVAGGGAGQCLVGNYDSSQQCCSPRKELEDFSSPLAVCPVGTFYAVNEKACRPYPVQEIVSASLEVGFISCFSGTGGGDGGDSSEEGANSCQPPTEGCSPSLKWSPTLCCCLACETCDRCRP